MVATSSFSPVVGRNMELGFVKSGRTTPATTLLICPTLPGLPPISWFRLEEEIAQ